MTVFSLWLVKLDGVQQSSRIGAVTAEPVRFSSAPL